MIQPDGAETTTEGTGSDRFHSAPRLTYLGACLSQVSISPRYRFRHFLFLFPDRVGGQSAIEPPVHSSWSPLLASDAWATLHLTFLKHSHGFVGSFLLPCGNLIAYHPVLYKEGTGNAFLSRNMDPTLYYGRSSDPDNMTLISNADMTGIAVVVASESLLTPGTPDFKLNDSRCRRQLLFA